jgi:hypothetical protein
MLMKRKTESLLALVLAASGTAHAGPIATDVKLCDARLVQQLRAMMANYGGQAPPGRCLNANVHLGMVYDENDFPIIGERIVYDENDFPVVGDCFVYDENDFPIAGKCEVYGAQDAPGAMAVGECLVYDENDFPVVGTRIVYDENDFPVVGECLVYDENDFPVAGPGRMVLEVHGAQQVRSVEAALAQQQDLVYEGQHPTRLRLDVVTRRPR